MNLLIYLFSLLIGVLTVNGDLSGRLKDYGTLHHSEIVEHQYNHHAEKRSTKYTLQSPNKVVSFTAMGRHFKLHLRRQEHLFSPNFHAEVRHSDSSSTSFTINPADFYVGYTEDEPKTSRVQAYYEGDNMVAQIKTKDAVYNIEPSWRHLPPLENVSMIAYKTSDLLTEIPDQPDSTEGLSHCGMDKLQPPSVPTASNNSDTVHSKKRSKRQAGSRNICEVMLVADYHFYDVIGNSDAVTTAKYLIGVLSRVDRWYKDTDFGDGYTNLGFELKGLIINEASTTGYNQQRTSWGATELLNAFGDGNFNWRDYCLAHLFTYLAFSDGTVGLAWVAAPDAGVAGGICSPVVNGRGYNTAWTTLSDRTGIRRLTLESDIVTAHEFGHNWGSQHDPSTSECAPSNNNGGKFIMYPISVAGHDPNNNVFSPCSKRNILEVLKTKSFNCFSELSTSICGNLKVDEGEQCDTGVADTCCDASCQLTPGSVCSDQNSGCCKNCQFKSSSEVCSQAVNISCAAEAKCTGSSPECPTPGSLPDGVPCIENGQCSGGKCQAFCETKNLTSCLCENVADSCKYCCRYNASTPCEVYDDGSMILPDGRTCVQGTCTNGECKGDIRTGSTRLWNVIKNLSFNDILQFMKNNVVLAVIILSLIIYVPLCIVVACLDCRRDKKDEEEVEWMSRDNDRLLSDKDNRLIRSATHRRVPQRAPATASGVNFGPL